MILDRFSIYHAFWAHGLCNELRKQDQSSFLQDAQNDLTLKTQSYNQLFEDKPKGQIWAPYVLNSSFPILLLPLDWDNVVFPCLKKWDLDTSQESWNAKRSDLFSKKSILLVYSHDLLCFFINIWSWSFLHKWYGIIRCDIYHYCWCYCPSSLNWIVFKHFDQNLAKAIGWVGRIWLNIKHSPIFQNRWGTTSKSVWLLWENQKRWEYLRRHLKSLVVWEPSITDSNNLF